MTENRLKIPQLACGCRVQQRSEDETVLLVPEGMLRLKGAAVEILNLVDGERTEAQIIDLLKAQYPLEAHHQIEAEVESFLAGLHTRSVLLFKET